MVTRTRLGASDTVRLPPRGIVGLPSGSGPSNTSAKVPSLKTALAVYPHCARLCIFVLFEQRPEGQGHLASEPTLRLTLIDERTSRLDKVQKRPNHTSKPRRRNQNENGRSPVPRM